MVAGTVETLWVREELSHKRLNCFVFAPIAAEELLRLEAYLQQ